MAYARADLVTKALGNLGIVLQADAGATRTRAELATETFANLGFLYQSDASATRTRAEWVTETLANLGLVQQPDTAAPHTLVELISRSAQILGVLPSGQTLSAEDSAIISSRVNTVIADLNARAVVTIANSNSIPAAQFEALAAILALAAKSSYEASGAATTQLMTEAAIAEKKLQNFGASAIIDEKLPSIVGELNARGIATVANIAAIPGAWFSALADIAAESCKGKLHIDSARSIEIATRAALAERNLKAITQVPFIDEKLPSIIAELNARMVATVDLTAIKASWFPSLADICAESVKGKFEVRPDIAAQLPVRAARAETILKNLNRSIIVDRNLDAIMAEIASDDLVSLVDDSDIPQEWFISLAAIVADRVKSEFDLSADVITRVMMQAEMAVTTLRRITRGRPSYNMAIPEWF